MLNNNLKKESEKFLKNIQKQECFLCKSIQKDLMIFEDGDFVVVLDAYPSVFGHVICAPKKHIKNLSDLSKEKTQELSLLIRKLDKILKNLFDPFRIAIVSSGLAVEHLHFHIIPVPNEEMMWDFKYLRKDNVIKYSDEKKNDLINKIKKEI